MTWARRAQICSRGWNAPSSATRTRRCPASRTAATGCSRGTRSSASWGRSADGHSFAQDAIDRGAKVLVVERKVYLADATDVTEVVVSDTRKAMAHAAANFHDHPSQCVLARGRHGHERQDHHHLPGGAHRARLRQAHGRHRHGGHAHRRRAGEDRPHHARVARPAAAVRAHARRALRRGGHGGELSHALDLLRTWNAAFSPSRRSPTSRRTTWTTTTPSTRTSRPRRCCSRATTRPAASSASTTSGAASFCAAAPRTRTAS